MSRDVIHKETGHCKNCLSDEIYRHWDEVDGELYDDGVFCENCAEWTVAINEEGEENP